VYGRRLVVTDEAGCGRHRVMFIFMGMGMVMVIAAESTAFRAGLS
jgi:hypothetical protein